MVGLVKPSKDTEIAYSTNGIRLIGYHGRFAYITNAHLNVCESDILKHIRSSV